MFMQPFASAPLNHAQYDFAQPYRHLHNDRDGEQDIDGMGKRRGRIGNLVHQFNRHHDPEKLARTRQSARDD